jgi:hypothetical protein
MVVVVMGCFVDACRKLGLLMQGSALALLIVAPPCQGFKCTGTASRVGCALVCGGEPGNGRFCLLTCAAATSRVLSRQNCRDAPQLTLPLHATSDVNGNSLTSGVPANSRISAIFQLL